MAHPYDEQGEYGAGGWRAGEHGENRDRWRSERDDERWTSGSDWRRSEQWEPGRSEPGRSAGRWGGAYGGERGEWDRSGDWRREQSMRGDWSRGDTRGGEWGRRDYEYRGSGDWDRGPDAWSGAPRGRDPRAARDTLEGGDLGWHGGVKGAEGGGGYGRGFFGTAYSLYAGRPERIESERHPMHSEQRRMGRGPKNFRRSDDRIQDEVCERIARSGVDADDVEVKVENGEVTLSGTVHRREDKWQLETLCDSVYGVDDVHNHLRTADRAHRSNDVPRTH